jgi:uncharacterized protein (TIGR03435 family)
VEAAGEAKPLFELNISSASGKFSMSSGGGELETRSIPFSNTIAYIWDVQDGQVIVDTPAIPSLNVTLKTVEENYDQGVEILKSAIQATFSVKVTPEKDETDVYALTLSTAPNAPRPTYATPGTHLMLTSYGGGNLVGSAEMPKIASVLWMSMDKPVVDETGLKGGYEFDMQWTYGKQDELVKLLSAHGLVLVPARRPVNFLRVTHVIP